MPALVATPAPAPLAVAPSLKDEAKKAAIPTFPDFEFADLYDEPKYGDWRDDIATKGYAVVPAMSPEKALALRDRAHEWMEGFNLGYKRDDPSTFIHEKLPVNMKGGMIHGYGVAHTDWVWQCRTDEGVIDAFAKAWGTPELITSFDGAALMLPKRKDLKDVGRWPHIDQNPFREGFYCLQGIVNLNYNNEDDGGLMVMENSNRMTNRFFVETGRTDTRSWGPVDWAGFNPDEEEWFFERGCKWVKVCAKPGDLILWDSRCIHMNCTPTGETDRTIAYVCMAPAKLLSEADRKKRVEAFEQYRGTTHVPFGSIFSRAHEPVKRQETGLPDPLDTGVPRNLPEVNDTVLKLVGALPY
ncbi:uncharacterized protein JCM10292_003085 [Rhodotorula paludigena]|uniref:uncharacterized protein n=1 Tax=Rhodotorula paludigena TaxID=86838 RepID=UPI00316CA516